MTVGKRGRVVREFGEVGRRRGERGERRRGSVGGAVAEKREFERSGSFERGAVEFRVEEKGRNDARRRSVGSRRVRFGGRAEPIVERFDANRVLFFVPPRPSVDFVGRRHPESERRGGGRIGRGKRTRTRRRRGERRRLVDREEGEKGRKERDDERREKRNAERAAKARSRREERAGKRHWGVRSSVRREGKREKGRGGFLFFAFFFARLERFARRARYLVFNGFDWLDGV